MRTTCTRERWTKAQNAELEYWASQGPDGDDYNKWWSEKFDGFKAVKWPAVRSLLEVGCGPFARNTRGILDTHYRGTQRPEIWLNDPLLYEYASRGMYVRTLIDHMGCRPNGLPLEELDSMPAKKVDALICINVVNHVYNIDSCFNAMRNRLAKGGFLIFGNEITNANDFARVPELRNDNDAKHPVFLDLPDIQKHLDYYKPILKKVLPQEEGRNPAAHYGTLIFIGRAPWK